MHKTSSGAIALLAFVLIQGSALAQTPSAVYDVLIDLDQNSTTGCVADPTGSTAFGGFERRLRATLDPDTQTLIDLAGETCEGTGFQNLIPLTAGQPAGLNNGVDGSDVLEFSVSINALELDSAVVVDLAFAADSGTGSDILATVDGSATGAPIVFGLPIPNLIPVPALSVLALLIMAGLLVVLAWAAHRRAGQVGFFSLVLLVATLAWAMNFIADGQVSDWNGIGPVANDPAGDATDGKALIDIRSAFAAVENNVLHVRLDLADIENQPPDVQDDSYTTDEDTALTVAAPGVLANDSDNNNDPISAVLEAGPANAASFTLNPDGSFDYTPADDFNGSDTFTYVANDGQADSAIATVTLTVDPINDPPVASDDSASTNEDAQVIIAVLANDSDLDGNLDPASVSIVTPPNDGTAAANPATGEITYTKTGDFNGVDSFTYEVCDDGTPTPALCDTATVDVTVDSVNDAPSFVAGSDQTVLEDDGAQTVAAWATAITAGPPDEAGQALTFNVTGNDNPGLFSVGPGIDSASGDLTFTPAADANGTASITITLSDDGGTANGGEDTSPPQTFNITVTAVNDAPSFTDGGNVSVLEDSGAYDQPWATAVLAGPPDESGQTLNFSVTGSSNAALFDVAPAIDASTGNLSFTPAANAEGSADITVELVDNGGTANGGDDTSTPVTFTITVADVNDAPSFTAGPDVNAPEDDGAQTIAAWATAIDDGDGGTQTLTFNVSTDNNALFSAQPAISPTGELTFTSSPEANGSALVTVTLSDDGGTANGGSDTSAPVDFTITIDPVNDAPVFTAGPDQSVLEDAGTQSVSNWATGISDGDDDTQALTFSVTNDNNALFDVQPAVDETGLLTYTPAADANGSALVTVTLSDDGSGVAPNVNTSAPQNFTITVDAVNDAPSFVVGGDQIINEDGGPVTIVGWATAIDPGAANEAGQTLTFNVISLAGNVFAGAPSVSPSGDLSFTLAADANGVGTVTLELSDNGGTASGGVDTSPAQSFEVTVNAVNDAPSFTPGANVGVEEDSGPYSQPWATAISPGPADEAGQIVTFNITANDNPGLFASAPTIDSTGTLSFEPQTGTVGVANVTVALQDNGGVASGGIDTSAPVSFEISVLQINDPPSFVVGPDQTVNEDSGPQTVATWATAISAGPPDEVGQILTFMVTGNTNAGLFSAGPSLSATGDLTFTPASNANGSATITLVLMDDGGTANGGVDTSPPQTFTINVTPTNDPPVVTPPASFAAHAHIGIDVPDGASDLLDGATITDPDGPGAAPFNVVAETIVSANGGSATTNANGSFTYDPPAGFTGADDTFVYQICDSGVPAPSQCAPVTATVAVSGPRVWFVDNTGPAGLGTLSSPLNTVGTAAAAADANGDRIFVFTGTGNYTGNVTLQADQRLIGQGVNDADFDTALGITAPATSVARPSINGTSPTISGTVTLANNAHARGFDINNTTASGISASSINGPVVNQLSVTTTTGTAVSVLNSNGAFSFTSISANGAANGIVINEFGGSFEITGDGSTAGSGGTIQNTSGNAVQLINTGNVSLNFLNIANSSANGVFGSDVTNFVLNGANLTNNGNAINEGGLRFDPNLLGTALISNSAISGSAEHNIEIINDSGTLSSLTISNSTISLNSAALGADGLLLETRNSAEANVIVSGTTFLDNRSDAIQISALDISTASLTVNDTVFQSTTDASPDGSVAAGAITLSAGSSADLAFDIGSATSNDFLNFLPNTGFEAIDVTLLSTSTPAAMISGRVRNNVFTNSGGAVGVDVRGDGSLVMEIDGNTGTTTRQPIDAVVGQASGDIGTADLTITNNTLAVLSPPIGFPNNEGISVTGFENTSICVNVRNNVATASGTRDDISLENSTAAGSLSIESGPTDCGAGCADAVAHLLDANLITTAGIFGSVALVAPGSCATVP